MFDPSNIQEHLDKAFELSDQHRYNEALIHFDIIEKSKQYSPIYYERGCCLQSLDYHLDAIDDFTKDIELFPGKAISYFMRSLSYMEIGDLDDAWMDNITAIQLSKANTEENIEANKRAKEQGYETATSFYEIRLGFVKSRMDFADDTKKHLNNPKIRREQ